MMIAGKSLSLDRRFLAFLLAGGLNTAFGYGLYGMLVLLGLVPRGALVCSTIAGVLFNFLTTGGVFGSHEWRLLPRFVATYAAILLANIVLLDLLIGRGVGPLAAQAGALVLFVPITFLAMRHLVFARRPES